MRMLHKYEGQIFRHFKGDLYLIIGFAQHTETGEKMVIYKALYGDCETYVRPYDMFAEEVPECSNVEGKNTTGQKFRFQHWEVESKL